MGKSGIWTREDLPDFGGERVFIINGAFFGAAVAMFAQCGFIRANTIEEADLVVFLGGADINPRLYGERALPCTGFNNDRDIVEETFYHKALKLKKPMYGICRGAQFLHAMNGGKLWQDVNNHGTPHDIIDIEEDVILRASSMHHQMLQFNDEIKERLTIMACCSNQVATKFEDANLKFDLRAKGANANHELEIEAGYYVDTRCLFVQGHPEAGPAPYRSWCMWKLNDWYNDLTPFKETVADQVLAQIG